MKARTREILSLIEDELIEEHKGLDDGNYKYRVGVGSELWNILSALRGPDSENEDEKEHTLEIRRLTFPRLAAYLDEIGDHNAGVGNGPVFRPSKNEKTFLPHILPHSHFSVHVYLANQAIRRKVNDSDTD